ncbi:MAG TPA: hypothetical protein VHB49_23280 [Bradyrhizobium sp.]|nr:hypothetical protein [Bradyrhizobium sp.]
MIPEFQEILRCAENKFTAAVRFVGIFVGIGRTNVQDDGYNPFRNLSIPQPEWQMIANISTPRPGVIELRDVTRVFKLISAPWMRARFGDVVGLALRFDALTIPRPGMVK